METAIKTTKEALAVSDLGLKCFMALIPGLRLRGDEPTKCVSVKSPFNSSNERSLSIYLYKVWMYKDHVTGDSGDIFKYIARTKGFDQKRDFPKILEIVQNICKRKDEEEAKAEEKNEGFQISYLSEQLNEILQKKHFADWGYSLSHTQFSAKAIETASFTDDTGELIELHSDLKKHQDVYFSFVDKATNTTMIYNPYQEEAYYYHESGSLPDTYLFGWYESLVYRNFHCTEVASNLIITNSIDNVLLFHSLGFPAICLRDSNETVMNFLRNVVLPQCPHSYIFFDNSRALIRAAKKLSKTVGASIIEFSRAMQDGIEQDRQYSEDYDENKVYRISGYHQLDDEHIGEYLSQFIG